MDRLATWIGAFILACLILAAFGYDGGETTVWTTHAVQPPGAERAAPAEEDQDDPPTVREITDRMAPWRL